ncbi:MAG: sulfite exporter TauE/SafE family protein [Cyclobacteriaceae bacterium]
MELFNSLHLTTENLAWVMFCAFCIGMSKTGLAGAGMLVVPIMASVFGAKESTGIVLPMLVMADIFGVSYYNRHAEIRYLIKLAPSTVLGVAVGIWVGDVIEGDQFTILLAIVILFGVGITIWQEVTRSKLIVHNLFFASIAGSLGGFTTMIGNAAGPVMSIYFLSMGLPKNNFIGTSAWFFFLVNVFKVPFHITIWNTITWDTFQFNLLMLPLIIVGALVGIKIVKLIPEKPYRIFILVTIVLASLKLFF